MPARAARRPTRDRSAETRARILGAVRELLQEGSFHERTVEEVAERAGISRATLYLHFASRLELVNGICDWMGENPALVELREKVDLPDPGAALAETLERCVSFWASEDAVLAELYGVVAADPAAADFVARQRADRAGEMERLARNLQRAGRLRKGVGVRGTLAQLMLLTSYESFSELRRTGLGTREIVRLLQDDARALLLRDDA